MFACRLLRSHLRRRCRAYGNSPAYESDVTDKIVFNSVLQSKKASQHWRRVREKAKDRKRVEMKCDVEPVALQYLDDYAEPAEPSESEDVEEFKDRMYTLPYSIFSKTGAHGDGERGTEDNADDEVDYDRKLRQDGVLYSSWTGLPYRKSTASNRFERKFPPSLFYSSFSTYSSVC